MKKKFERPKVRKTWGELNPVTRVVPNKKKYDRRWKAEDY